MCCLFGRPPFVGFLSRYFRNRLFIVFTTPLQTFLQFRLKYPFCLQSILYVLHLLDFCLNIFGTGPLLPASQFYYRSALSQTLYGVDSTIFFDYICNFSSCGLSIDRQLHVDLGTREITGYYILLRSPRICVHQGCYLFLFQIFMTIQT